MRRASRLLTGSLLALLVAGCSGAGTTPGGTGSPSGPASSPSAGASPTAANDWAQRGPNELLPIPVSSELAVGQNRFLLNLVDDGNEPLADPDRQVELHFYELSASEDEPAFSVTTDYLPTIPSLPGLYRAQVEFPRAGEWGVEAEAFDAQGTRVGRTQFNVREAFSTPAIGAPAPESATPTADGADEIARLSTDTDPNPAFYATSVAEALAADEPFVLVFSTPAFCRTATCGPTLDIVKDVAPDYAESVTFIHVEPYELEQGAGGALQPVLENGQLVPVPWVLEWGLLTEPYVFVVDAEGNVAAKLEGIASEEELRAALEDVAP